MASAILLRFLAGAQSSPGVLEISVDTVIQPITGEIVDRGVQQAARDRDALIILRLNTPGGLIDAMREIISKIEASPVPVVAYVAPSGGRAASAGFFLLEAADIAAMAPGTNTGAAHPVAMTGTMEPVMKQKVENDAAAAMRTLAAKREHNSDLAESAVRESKSFTEGEAIGGHLIELLARDERDLLNQLDGRTIKRFNGSSQTLHLKSAVITQFEPSLRQRVLVTLSDPNLALILLVLGGLGIYMEFNAPGMIFPGVAGAICGLLALASLSVLPISWLGASLLILAAVFFALELKTGSHGVLGVGGAVSLVIGCLMLIDSSIPEMRIHLATALGIVLPFGLITAFLITIAARARRNKRITGSSGMIGEIGVAVEELNPLGRIFAHGEYWIASSDATVRPGERVKILALNGLQLKVDKVKEA